MNLETLDELQFATVLRRSPDGDVESMSEREVYESLASADQLGTIGRITFVRTLDT